MSDKIRRALAGAFLWTSLFQVPSTLAQELSVPTAQSAEGTAQPHERAGEDPGAPAVISQPSAKHSRAADDAYLVGAKHFDHKQFKAAEASFARAVQLDPDNRNYLRALLVARETRLTELVQEAAKARLLGDAQRANTLLKEGQSLDPKDPIVAQRLEPDDERPVSPKAANQAPMLAGPIKFTPSPGTQCFHLRGDLREIVHTVYNAFGIAVTFDSSLVAGTPVRFDVDDVDYFQTTRILGKMGRFFDVPINSTTALIARDTKQLREDLMPLVEETVYFPGRTPDQLIELVNLARNVFGLKQVSIGSASGSIVLRGDEEIIQLVDELFTDLMERESDVLLDVTLYELDRTDIRNIGLALPTSASVIDVSNAATNLINANQSLLNQAISTGNLKLSGNTYAQELEEVEYLVAAGVSGSSTFTSLLGTVGTFEGAPLAGVSVASTTLNLLLSSTEVRTLDALQIRASNGITATFRVGSRYPVLTSLTSSTSSSTTASELAAAGVSSSVIAKYGGTSTSSTTPQIQFEDVGITLKITPRVLEDLKVRLALDLKVEALAGTGVDNNPIFSNRALVSTVTVAGGQTTTLATLVSTDETKVIDGLPDLGDLPGFQGSNQSINGIRNELLITVTPHIVNGRAMRVMSRRVVTPRYEGN